MPSCKICIPLVNKMPTDTGEQRCCNKMPTDTGEQRCCNKMEKKGKKNQPNKNNTILCKKKDQKNADS